RNALPLIAKRKKGSGVLPSTPFPRCASLASVGVGFTRRDLGSILTIRPSRPASRVCTNAKLGVRGKTKGSGVFVWDSARSCSGVSYPFDPRHPLYPQFFPIDERLTFVGRGTSIRSGAKPDRTRGLVGRLAGGARYTAGGNQDRRTQR